ncbi:MAG: LCP family protein [Tyzzerella sp.]|nr:LCP family protein [Tyzzerella sp.]
MAQKRRRRRRKQKKIIQWFKKLSTKQKVLLISGVVVLLLMLAGVIYVASIFNKLDTQKLGEDEIFINEDLPDTIGVGYTNFVLFGGDSRSGEVNKNLNTDTIIIVSLNNETKEVKMVSVYRDTLLDVTNGKIKKCNSAYNIGGAKQAINMLNMNLDLDIKKYVTVDFSAVVDLVDMVGGIEVEVSKAEMKEMNKFIGETASVSGKKANYIKSPGMQKLDGVQATTYSRIRKNVGNDYARTERQRLVIQKVVEKAMKSNLSTINKIIDELFPRISTNFTMTEILSYAKDFKKYSFGETSGFPFKKGSGKIPGKGDSVFPITLKSNVSELHAFLFGTEDYQPSSKVVEISGEIAYIVGNRKPDKDTSNTGNGNTGNTGTSDESDVDKPNQQPEDPNQQPEDPNQQPEDPNQQPEDPNQQPEDPNQQPEDPNQQPEDPSQQPEDPNQQPEDPNQQPEDPNQQPEDPNNPTDNPMDNPTEEPSV